MIFYRPAERDEKLFPCDPFKGVIAPRPIGWISTMSKAGETNLAPYGFFNAFGSRPQIVGFASESVKDSATFAVETGEFVWSMATWDLREPMNATSEALPRGQNEFDFAGLAPARLVRPPLVAASPASLECKVTQTLRLAELQGKETGGLVVFGQVVGVHIDERYLKNGRFDLADARAIASCGYDEYAMVERVFSMKRPESGGNAYGPR